MDSCYRSYDGKGVEMSPLASSSPIRWGFICHFPAGVGIHQRLQMQALYGLQVGDEEVENVVGAAQQGGLGVFGL